MMTRFKRYKPTLRTAAVLLPTILTLAVGLIAAIPRTDNGAVLGFLNANRLYAEGDFAAAADLYRSQIDFGIADPAVHYNLANAYHKMGRTALAILHYERAHRLAPRDRDIRLNLVIARMVAIDEIEPLPRHFIIRFADRFQDYLNINEKLALAGAGYLLAMVGLHLLLLGRNRRRRPVWLTAVWLGAAVLLVFGTSAAIQVAGEMSHPRVVVTETVVRVRAEPDARGEEIFNIHAGTTAVTEDRREDWIEIRLDDGKYGWIPESAAAYIP